MYDVLDVKRALKFVRHVLPMGFEKDREEWVYVIQNLDLDGSLGIGFVVRVLRRHGSGVSILISEGPEDRTGLCVSQGVRRLPFLTQSEYLVSLFLRMGCLSFVVEGHDLRSSDFGSTVVPHEGTLDAPGRSDEGQGSQSTGATHKDPDSDVVRVETGTPVDCKREHTVTNLKEEKKRSRQS